MDDLRTHDEYMYFGEDGNRLDSFYDYLISIPSYYGTQKWFKYKNYVFIAATAFNLYFIRKNQNKKTDISITKKELLHTLKILIRKEKISKIKKINIL